MNDLLILPMITERDGVPVTTSRALADHFGKRHDNVLRDIEATIAQLNETEDGKAFNLLNFEEISGRDAMNREQPMYLLTRDAFTLLAMGFTGSRALAFKVAYINAFNRMEKLLTGRAEAQTIPSPTIAPAQPSTFSDRLIDALCTALDGERYTLRRKYGKPLHSSAEIVGVYDGSFAAIGTRFACKIWKQASGETISPITLRALLINDGTISPDDERRRVQRIEGRDVSTVHIPVRLMNLPL